MAVKKNRINANLSQIRGFIRDNNETGPSA